MNRTTPSSMRTSAYSRRCLMENTAMDDGSWLRAWRVHALKEPITEAFGRLDADEERHRRHRHPFGVARRQPHGVLLRRQDDPGEARLGGRGDLLQIARVELMVIAERHHAADFPAGGGDVGLE